MDIKMLYTGKTGGASKYIYLGCEYETVTVSRVPKNIGPDKIVTHRVNSNRIAVDGNGEFTLELTKKNAEFIKTITATDSFVLLDEDQMGIVDAILVPPAASENVAQGGEESQLKVPVSRRSRVVKV